MKIEVTKVLEYLKPKVKALGFKKDDVESIAADIADNLDEVEDDASDEDINAKIKQAVDAVIPSLKFAQKMINKGIEDYRKKQEQKANEQKPEEKKPDEKKPEEKTEEKPSSIPPTKEDDETSKLMKEFIESSKATMEQQKQLIESLRAEINGIKTKTTAEKRKAILDEILKDTGTFGKRTLKSFEKMTFETDEEFNDFVSEVKEDLEQLNQERANEGLAKLGAPQVETLQQQQQEQKPKPLSDAEVEELAASM